MERPNTYGTISLLFLAVFQPIRAFNVDVAVPIVKEGKANSYFGYSVAQHRIQGSSGSQPERRVILVGAPLDNITHSSASRDERSLVQPGVIYSCPVTSLNHDCVELRINEPQRGADKNGKWLGVTVASQGTEDAKAVACAHRYSLAGPSYRWPQGMCILMSNSLTEHTVHNPCAALDVSTGHSAFGMCQSGTSLDISEDGDFLIGLPGPYNWRGAIYKNIVEPTFEEDFMWYGSPAKSPYRRPPLRSMPDPVPAEVNSYLGMSSSIGTILNGEKTYVGGAPHSQDFGQVMLFTQGDDRYLEIQQTLTGDQFGAGFGYSLEVLDLNNDRKQDLVVGAPFYHGGRGGAIYIYMNGNDGITSETKPLKILSPKMSQDKSEELVGWQYSQFGLSLAALGDLDRDGYEDLAVGAPFEGDGTVYIFRGSASGIIQEYSQRIRPSSDSLLLAQPLKTFGSSLKGGMDMDGNGYPDLVVGAFDSNKALILRTRPVIDVTAEYRLDPQVIDTLVDICDKILNTGNCFDVTICFNTLAESGKRFSSKIKLIYKIEAEPNRKVSRVYFEIAKKTNQRKIEGTIELSRLNSPQPSCTRHRLRLANKVRDLVNPIQLQLTYNLENGPDPVMTPGSPLPDLDEHPVIDGAKTIVNILVPFKKDCGDDNLCQSQLVLSGSVSELNKDTDGPPILKVGQIDVLQVVAVVRNDGEDAHEASLKIVLPDKLRFINASKDTLLPDQDKRISCRGNQNIWTCPIGNPMKMYERRVFKLNLDPTDIPITEKLTEISLRVNTMSEEMDPGDDFVKLVMKVVAETDLELTGYSHPREVPYSGEIIGESAIRYEDQIGNKVLHTFVVSNDRHIIDNVFVHILWPYKVEDGQPIGKHLLYLLEEPLIDHPGKCSVSPTRINPLDVKPREGPLERGPQQRKVKKTQEVQDPISGEDKSVVMLDCDRATAKCFTIDCVITPMNKNEEIKIKLRSRLWSSTFLEDYQDVDHVKIFVKARVEIDPNLNIRQTTTDNDIFTIETRAVPKQPEMFKPPGIPQQPGIPVWLFIVAVVVGVLLLTVSIVVLWKVGFFKRTRVCDHPDYKKT